jgi:16S rRNA (cytosine967-C5)-methyltransferase
MTPGARVAAAIEVLDAMAGGLAAEQALTRWARQSRYAGSKDRAAVRDHVFDVLRLRRTSAFFGGGETGRALMIGLLHQQGVALETLFDGVGHAPVPLDEAERAAFGRLPDQATRWNLPDWLMPEVERSLGAQAEATAIALQTRAPITLRVNLGKTTRAAARDVLADQGIDTEENSLAQTALTITSGARQLRQSQAYLEGLVELQDAASQAVVAAVPSGERCLDYCAGGGGKALALAAQDARNVSAHDRDPRRMGDLEARALRAGVRIPQLAPDALEAAGPFDVVLCDVPCSGSGAWRRSPEGKWLLTTDKLAELTATQDAILRDVAGLVQPAGVLVYATCSVLKCENQDRIDAFVASHPGWTCSHAEQFSVSEEGDGFFTAHLTRV